MSAVSKERFCFTRPLFLSKSYTDSPRLKQEKKIEPTVEDEAEENREGGKKEARKVRSGQ